MKLKHQSTSVTLEHSRARPLPVVSGWICCRAESSSWDRPRMAFSSLHTAARRATDRSALAVTQQCSECRTYHWTAAFISFLLSVHACHFKTRRQEKMAFGCHTLRHSRVQIILLLNQMAQHCVHHAQALWLCWNSACWHYQMQHSSQCYQHARAKKDYKS